MENYISEIQSLFQQERLRDAGSVIKRFEEDFPEEAKENELARIIKQDLSLADQCLHLLGDMDDWTLVKQSENIATFTKGNSSDFMVRAEMTMKHSIFPILALFSECQLLNEWVPILEDAKVIGSPSKFRRLIQYFLKMPWPIENRDAVVSAVGIPIQENRSILIVLKSIDENNYLSFPIPETNSTRIDINPACLNIHQIESNEVQISLVARVDVKLALIPVAIVNYAAKHGVFYFMNAVKEMCDEYSGSKYEELVRSKPEYYQEIRRRLSTFA
ncbi:hypothetical protein SteCoe_37673 [Stentor coeruleus]|uniref:START domain-containing protein n=1 Tax=Stentor coeruleus TaxID=5963 RepID=A0A1R2AMI3_9CILI|nr:hypothetical protein SteCoe_37673 [Stentor coeruleus]